MITISRRVLALSSRISHLHCNQAAGYSKFRMWLAMGITLISLSIITMVGLNKRARSWRRFQLTKRPAIAIQQPSTQALGQRAKLQAELITLLPYGFMPATITRPKSPFVLAVDNRSGLDVMSLQLTRETGNKIHEVIVPGETLDWNKVFDLDLGRYVLSEINHPKWRCTLIITAE
jgi:heme exporter protein D